MAMTICRIIPTLLLCACLSGCSTAIKAQSIFVNTISGLYELNGGAGSCNSSQVIGYCSPGFGGLLYSTAMYKDTLFFITFTANRLYKVKIGEPNTCTFVTGFPIPTLSYHQVRECSGCP